MVQPSKASKVAIVTGASRGIGAAVAERLARDGFSVIVNYTENAAPAEDLVRKIGTAGGRALAVRADVGDPGAVRRMFEIAERELGGVDVLVNNAGVMPLEAIAKMDDATFDRLIAVNLKGSFNTMREAANRLREGGRVINFSSSTTGIRRPNYGPYAATKAAIETMTSVLAKELAGKNITVNAVAPGPIATDLIKNSDPAVIQNLVSMTPLRRLGERDDVAGVVSFLAGPDGGWVNGQTLRANGGLI